MRVKRCLVMAGILLLLIPPKSRATEIHGRSMTQISWYDDIYTGSRADLAQYLRLYVKDIDTKGKFSLYGYGRGIQAIDGQGRSGDSLSGRLYYLYGDYHGLFDCVDFRLGRQFIASPSGNAIVDGLNADIDLKKIVPLGIRLWGGKDVIFGTDREFDGSRYAAGASLYLAGLQNTDVEVSWFRKWEGDAVLLDIVGGTFKQNLWKSANVYGNARYDLATESFNELLAGVKIFPSESLVLTGEYYQSYPTFETTSIFSVFAVSRYSEKLVRADYMVTPRLVLNGGYIRQDYGDDGTGDTFEAGFTAYPLGSLSISARYDRHRGVGGKLDGGAVDATYDVTSDVQMAGGLAYDAYQRDNMTSFDDALKGWLAGKYRAGKGFTISCRIEENRYARNAGNSLAGRFIVDYDF